MHYWYIRGKGVNEGTAEEDRKGSISKSQDSRLKFVLSPNLKVVP
jgi:hypothetical protein